MFVHGFRSAELNGCIIRIFTSKLAHLFQRGLDADLNSRSFYSQSSWQADVTPITGTQGSTGSAFTS